MTTVVNRRTDRFDVYIGRGSIWGNPYSHKNGTLATFKVNTRDDAVKAYKDYILHGDGKHLLKELPKLHNLILGCYCKPAACHGDVLAELANSFIDYNDVRIWYYYKIAQDGDKCLATLDPTKINYGMYIHSTEIHGNDKAFVIHAMQNI